MTTLPTTNAAKPAKKLRVSKRLRKVLVALAKGQVRTLKAAAELANLNESHLSRILAENLQQKGRPPKRAPWITPARVATRLGKA